MNNEIAVNLGDKSYKIKVGSAQIQQLPSFLAEKSYSKIFIITDKNVANLHLPKLENVLKGHKTAIIKVEAGEQSKSFAVLEQVCDEILQQNVDRKSLIIAFGGGVIGDLSGFAASILLRGIDFIQVPTTLLACVDSSIGGKTAINSNFGKNLVGSFYQPKLVICDLDFLETLPERELKSGYCEILKHALIDDKNFFEFLDQNLEKIFAKNHEIMQKIIAKSCEIKAKIVAADEKENSVRALLNYGHTFGHVFESELKYSSALLHGEAVAIGILLAAKMSLNFGMITKNDVEIIARHLQKAGLNFDLKKIKNNWNKENLVGHLYKDKKTQNQSLTFILLSAIGKAEIKKSVDVKEFLRVIDEII